MLPSELFIFNRSWSLFRNMDRVKGIYQLTRKASVCYMLMSILCFIIKNRTNIF